tara:strand:+ start:1274 stop:1576 length:303 start_codon:yes stop_codon:yes gene_type:complete
MNNTITYKNLLNSVSSDDLGRDEDSLNVFEWILEDHYENLIKKNKELFNQRPDLYHIANEQILFELNRMLEHFVDIEEYEKCAKILNTSKEIEKIIKKQV